MKICSKCAAQFDPPPPAKGSVCLPCMARLAREYQARRRAAGIRRAQWSREQRRQWEKEYYKRQHVRDKRRERAAADWRSPAGRSKILCRAKLQQKVRSGKIKHQPCELCGATAQAHHDDYSKPFDVRWMCPIHHTEAHRKAEIEKEK